MRKKKPEVLYKRCKCEEIVGQKYPDMRDYPMLESRLVDVGEKVSFCSSHKVVLKTYRCKLCGKEWGIVISQDHHFIPNFYI